MRYEKTLDRVNSDTVTYAFTYIFHFKYKNSVGYLLAYANLNINGNTIF